MSKTETIRARIGPVLKEKTERIFCETTRKTFEDTDAGKNLVICRDADDMFKQLSKAEIAEGVG